MGMGDDCVNNAIVSYCVFATLLFFCLLFLDIPMQLGVSYAHEIETAIQFVWGSAGLSVGHTLVLGGLIAPTLAFSARPHSPRYWRASRSLFAFAVIYGGVFLATAFSSGFLARVTIVWLLQSWHLTLIYVGCWELAWRMRYRKSMKNLCMGMGDDFINNSILAALIPTAFLSSCILIYFLVAMTLLVR
jgi:hypothetical protein